MLGVYDAMFLTFWNFATFIESVKDVAAVSVRSV